MADGDTEDEAAQAFESLRAEVSLMRRGRRAAGGRACRGQPCAGLFRDAGRHLAEPLRDGAAGRCAGEEPGPVAHA